jgi:succinate dehydrogenase hydrophobic anchor subunit
MSAFIVVKLTAVFLIVIVFYHIIHGICFAEPRYHIIQVWGITFMKL